MLLWWSARGYEHVNPDGLSFEEAFLVIPIVLHRATREVLPRTARTSLAGWIASNPLVQGRIAKRASTLVNNTRESILFGSTHGLIRIENGRVLPNVDYLRTINRALRNASEEVELCAQRAKFVGKWFALTGSATTVLALLGVRP